MRELLRYICVASLLLGLGGTAAAIPLDESRAIRMRSDDGNAPERVLTGQWGCPAQGGVIFPTKPQNSVDPGPFIQGTGGNDPNSVNGHWGHGCSIPAFLDVDPNFTFGGTNDSRLATVKIDNLIWTNALALPVATGGVFLSADPNLFCAPGFGTAGDWDIEIHEDGSADSYYPARLTLFFCAFPPLPLVFGQQHSSRRGDIGYFFREGDANQFAGPSPIIPRGNANQVCNPATSGGPSGDWSSAAPVPGLTPVPLFDCASPNIIGCGSQGFCNNSPSTGCGPGPPAQSTGMGNCGVAYAPDATPNAVCGAIQALALANPGCALGPDPTTCGLPVDYLPGACRAVPATPCIQDSDCVAPDTCLTGENCNNPVPQYAIDATCTPLNLCPGQGTTLTNVDCPGFNPPATRCADPNTPGAVPIGQVMESPNNGSSIAPTNGLFNQVIVLSPTPYSEATGYMNNVGNISDQTPPLILTQNYQDLSEIQLCETQGCPLEVPLASNQWIYALLALLLGSTLFYARYRRVAARQS